MGNMGSAMLQGMLTVFEKEEIVFTRADEEKKRVFSQETGIDYAASNRALAGMAKYIILAVKPQYFNEVLNEIKETLSDGQIIISIAAGISIGDMKAALGEHIRVVRAMPNTPAMVSEGMTGVCFDGSDYSEGELLILRKIFESFGRMQVVDERLFNGVICASGSSPAYVYLFIEALADGAVKYGLPRKTAYEMAAQTVLGAARMVLETGEHPGALKDRVCSPGGTTICGVAALEEYGFRNAVLKAADACYERAVSMDKKGRE